MITSILFSYIISHGYFDILKFKDKIISSKLYILFGIPQLLVWKYAPLITLYIIIYSTYIHFENDFRYFLINKNNLPISMFTGTLIGWTNLNYWMKTLINIGLTKLESQVFVVSILIYNAIKIKNISEMSIIMLFYGYILGPYYAILIYMLFHTTLALYKSYKYDFNHRINASINSNKNNFFILLALINIIQLIIVYSNFLEYIDKQLYIDTSIIILIPHLCLHNYGTLDDTIFY